MALDKIIEALIREAQKRGEFDNLPGKGKLIDLTEYFNTPEDIRVAQSLLKNAGMVSREIELLQEIAELKQILKTKSEQINTFDIEKSIMEKQLQLSLLIEQRKR